MRRPKDICHQRPAKLPDAVKSNDALYSRVDADLRFLLPLADNLLLAIRLLHRHPILNVALRRVRSHGAFSAAATNRISLSVVTPHDKGREENLGSSRVSRDV